MRTGVAAYGARHRSALCRESNAGTCVLVVPAWLASNRPPCSSCSTCQVAQSLHTTQCASWWSAAPSLLLGLEELTMRAILPCICTHA